MNKTRQLKIATLTLLALALAVSTVIAGQAEIRLRGELIAPLNAGDVSGRVDFRDRGRRQFSVEVEGFLAGDMFDVTVSNVVVGTITIDQFGAGNLDFDDTAGPLDQDAPFPANFPMLDGGEMVTVGPLSGTLNAR